MIPSEALGVAIDAERVAARLSRDALAEAVQISPETLGRHLRGEAEPSLARLRDLAAALDMRPQDLLDRADVVAGKAERRASVAQRVKGSGNLIAGGDINIEAGAVDIKAEGRT